PLYLVAQIQDISERIQAEAALREAEARFRSVFEHAPIGEAIVALDGRFRQVNRALCELVGYTEEELLARGALEITHPDDAELHLEPRGRLMRGEIRRYQIEKRYIHKEGHSILAMLSISLLRDGAG